VYTWVSLCGTGSAGCFGGLSSQAGGSIVGGCRAPSSVLHGVWCYKGVACDSSAQALLLLWKKHRTADIDMLTEPDAVCGKCSQYLATGLSRPMPIPLCAGLCSQRLMLVSSSAKWRMRAASGALASCSARLGLAINAHIFAAPVRD